MMEFFSISMKLLIPLAQLLGFDTPAKLWYLLLAILVVGILWRQMSKIKEAHRLIFNDIKELSVKNAELKGDFNELESHQTMQEKYVKEQEARYNRVCKALIDNALDSAICRNILENNNIKAKD